jgi:hypothetical protein
MRARLLFAATCLGLAGCAGAHLASKPGEYAVTVQPVHTMGREIHATYVRPVQNRHPGYLVVFTTGDDGWLGTSGAVFEHLAAEGYTIAGFSAPEALQEIVRSGKRISTVRAAQELKDLYAQAKRHLDLPDSTPIIIVGFSRGASGRVHGRAPGVARRCGRRSCDRADARGRLPPRARGRART